MQYKLTKQEKRILELNAAGLQVQEIARHIGRSFYTVQKHICNIKEKTGLQKATELVALYFCERLTLDFADFKRQVMAAGMVALMIFAECRLQAEFMRFRSRQQYERVSVCRHKRRNEDFNFITV
jgi:DNA-binding CsgD family transcriptional regulator